MRKYGLYVGGTTWAPYLPLDFTVALIISCLEGIVTSDRLLCLSKLGLSIALILIQFVILVVKRPLGARFDWVSAMIGMSFTLFSGVLYFIDLAINHSNPAISLVRR